MALTDNLPFALGFGFGAGIANMAFIIPSQAMFQQPDAVGADGSGRQLPVRAGLRGDDASRRRSAALLLIVLSASAVLVIFSLVTIGGRGRPGCSCPRLRDA